MGKTTESSSMNQQGLKHLADLEQLTLTFAGKLQGEFLELASAQTHGHGRPSQDQ